MHLGTVFGHWPEHADGVHALVSLFQVIGSFHRAAKSHYRIPFRGRRRQPGDQVGTARSGGHQRHPGLAGQAPDRRRHKCRVGFVTHHHRFYRRRILQRIKYPVNLGPRDAEYVFNPLRLQIFHH
ncbi:hypothetical protein D3C78_817080 [compost metagenome]